MLSILKRVGIFRQEMSGAKNITSITDIYYKQGRNPVCSQRWARLENFAHNKCLYRVV